MLAHKDWRGEVISAEIIHLNNSSRPLLTADITLNQQPLRLLSFHATRSRSQATADGQSVEFAALAEWSTQQTTPLLIVGDFNSTPYSVKFRQLVENSGLQDGQYGHGWQSSWPAQLPRYLRIPIDLTLHGDSVSINSLHAGENVNSDHLPLNISITIQQSSR